MPSLRERSQDEAQLGSLLSMHLQEAWGFRVTYKKCMAFIYSSCVHVWSRATVHLWTPEDNFQELVLSFTHVGSRDQTQSSGLAARAFTL